MQIKNDWNSVEEDLQRRVREIKQSVNSQAQSRAIRASNELRNAALVVLSGKRSGRIYRIPYSKSTYRASAPGEAPASRTGMLRRSWGMFATGDKKGDVIAGIRTDVKYAPWLNDGTDDGHIKPRPFEKPIIERAEPRIRQIYSQPYINK